LPALQSGRVDAVINDGPILSYEIHTRYREKLEVLPIHLNEEFYGFCVREGSSLREPINRSLLQRLAEPNWQELLRRYLGDYE
jgi:polar amino acid transport system substrate-binding protein